MLGDDHAGRPGAVSAPAHRAEVVRISDLVEAGDQRPLADGEVERVRVPVRLAEGDHALVVAAPGELVQLPLALDVDAQACLVAQPRLRRDRAFGDEELEDLPAPGPEDFSHRPTPVDKLASQSFLTSRKPSSGMSCISQPSSFDLVPQAVRFLEVSGGARGGSRVREIHHFLRRFRVQRKREAEEQHGSHEQVDSAGRAPFVMSASAAGVLKSSSSAAVNSSQPRTSAPVSTTSRALRKS